MSKHFGTWLRDHREALLAAGNTAFTLRRFAAACDLSPTFISRLERGEFEPPSGEKLAAMVELLGADRWDFFRRAGRPDPELTDLVQAPSRGMWRLLGLLRDGEYSEGDCEDMIRWLTERKTAQKLAPPTARKGAK